MLSVTMVCFKWCWMVILLCCTTCVPSTTTSEEKDQVSPHRSKRNLWQFRSLVNCLSDIGCMEYNNYGCWCGRGHSGEGKTLDAIDECCKEHDLCYKDARSNGCTLFKHPKVVLYDYIMDCDREMILCTDPAKSCDLQVCTCDRQASFCFAKHAGSYNPALKELNSHDKQRLCNKN